jgi:hypothetical protein
MFNLGITWKSHLYAPAALFERKFLNSACWVGKWVHLRVCIEAAAKKKISVPAGNETPFF